MLLWCDGAHDAVENMARDARLLALREREGPAEAPVLRLFAFSPPGITLGRGQDAAHELDRDRCRADGIAWAVRPTGGRAIFHDREWTYSFAARLDDPEWGGTAPLLYERLNRLLVAALQRLGVPATLEAGRPRGRASPRGAAGAAAPCFASTARHEVVLEGRKLVGSAQRVTARALLQQGSLLLGAGHLRLVDYQALDPGRRGPARLALARAATHAGAWLGEAPPLDRWAEALLAVLPPGVRRLDGEAGLPLLAPEPFGLAPRRS